MNTQAKTVIQNDDELLRLQELQENHDAVEYCLKCEPADIIVNPSFGNGLTPVTHIADINDLKMRDKYRGCGDGLAYVVDNKVVAFHYGIQIPTNVSEKLKNNVASVMFSCGTICFVGFENKSKQTGTLLPTKTLKELGELLNGNYWEKGNMQRVYLPAGHNTRKMSTKTFVWQNDEGEFKVSCKIDCPSQPYKWISSQEESIKNRIYEDIREIMDGKTEENEDEE